MPSADFVGRSAIRRQFREIFLSWKRLKSPKRAALLRRLSKPAFRPSLNEIDTRLPLVYLFLSKLDTGRIHVLR